jgi:hypothetical protein
VDSVHDAAISKTVSGKISIFWQGCQKNEFVRAEEKAQEAFLTAFVSAVEGATS